MMSIAEEIEQLNRQRGVWARPLRPDEYGREGYVITYAQAGESYVSRARGLGWDSELRAWQAAKERLRKAMAKRMH